VSPTQQFFFYSWFIPPAYVNLNVLWYNKIAFFIQSKLWCILEKKKEDISLHQSACKMYRTLVKTRGNNAKT